MILNKDNVFLFDFKTNEQILNFSMDTIKIEPIIYPDLMYKNYKELYDWMAGLGFPKDHKQYAEYGATQEYRFPDLNPEDQRALAQHSDATLTLLDSNNNAKINIQFQDAFPISLQGMDFEISTGQTDYMVGVAMFAYTRYEIETV